MINIIKQEITIEESLKQRLEFICEFSHTTPTFINGFIHKVDKTNLSYVEPHKKKKTRLSTMLIKLVKLTRT